MTFAADEFTEINKRRREIRREEKKPDDDPNSATGTDLESIAAAYDVWRTSPGESDWSLRQRMLDARRKQLGAT